MAAGDYTYSAAILLPDTNRLDNLANGEAVAFGRIDNSTEGAIDYAINVTIGINPVATSGSYTLYLVESIDDTVWTDGVDPTSALNQAGKINDAKIVKIMGSVYEGTNRTETSLTFNISDMTSVAPYFALVALNESGQDIPAAGNAGNSRSMKVS